MRWLAVGLAVVLAASGCARRASSEAGDYLFLFVWELNNRALRAAPLALKGEAGSDFDARERSVRVARPEERPRSGTRALVLHRADSLDLTLASRAFPVARLPARIPVDGAIDRPGRVRGKEAEPVALPDVVDDGTRLLPGPLVLEGIEDDGTAALRWGERAFRLKPGGAWVMALARGPSGTVEPIADDDRWAELIGERLDGGDTLTVLRVFNHGWWPKARVRVGAGS